MARKSASDLGIVPLSGGGRPEPPGELDAIEQSIWRAVIDASPAYAIDPAAQLILKRLVGQAALCEQREARLRALRADRPDDNEELIALRRTRQRRQGRDLSADKPARTPRSRVRLRAADSQTPNVPLSRPWERKLA
jgi:hypothetical protein